MIFSLQVFLMKSMDYTYHNSFIEGNTVEIVKGQLWPKHDRRESYVVVVNNKAQTRYRTVTDWKYIKWSNGWKIFYFRVRWSKQKKLRNNCPIYA